MIYLLGSQPEAGSWDAWVYLALWNASPGGEVDMDVVGIGQ